MDDYSKAADNISKASTQLNKQVNETSHDMADKAREVAGQAQELGAQALDNVDEWLKPVGLSLKERPVQSLAILGGVALAVGAIWMSNRSNRSSQLSSLINDISAMAKRQL